MELRSRDTSPVLGKVGPYAVRSFNDNSEWPMLRSGGKRIRDTARSRAEAGYFLSLLNVRLAKFGQLFRRTQVQGVLES